MKFFYALIIIFFFSNCSFDNKTGIWNNENSVSKKEDSLFEEFETLSSFNKSFDQEIYLKKDFKFKLTNSINNSEWNDIFYDKTNNLKNLKYNQINKKIFKSRRLTKHQINNYILFKENHLITSDQKGNIIVFSINEDKIIFKFNFYKKKYKKIEKILNIIIENNVIYVSDNIGYLYAFDFNKNKILWAKNYKIPFRSNLKLSGNKLIASNQNNNLYFFDKNSGEILKLIPTEETSVKNLFINNLSLNKNSLFFLNTYGSLYSVDTATMRLNWFVNLNQSLDINPSNLFFGSQIINSKDNIVISSNDFTYIIDSNTGSILHKKNFFSQVKPIIYDEYIFLITKKNLLIAMNLISGEILYSHDINVQIAEFLNIKKKKVQIKNMMLINNNFFIFLKNSYFLIFNINGKLDIVNKLPSKILSEPIVIDGSILYLNNKNKLIVLD